MNNKTNWIGGPDEPLLGFEEHLRPIQILLWNDVFLHTNDLGEEIAIILTHQILGHETPLFLNSSVFSTLISSFQLYQSENGRSNTYIQNTKLIGDLKSQTESGTSFLNIILKYHIIKGRILFDKVKNRAKRHIDVEYSDESEEFEDNLRKTALMRETDYFEPYYYFSSFFNAEFIKGLIILIESLLSPDNLETMKINNVEILGYELNEYIKTYLQLFESKRTLPIQYIYEATVDSQMNLIVNSSLNSFKQILYSSELFIEGSFSPYLKITYELAKNNTMVLFKNEKKMGNQNIELKFTKILEQKVDEIFTEWKRSALLDHVKYHQVRDVVQEQSNAASVESTKYELVEMKIQEAISLGSKSDLKEKFDQIKTKGDNIRDRLSLSKFLLDFAVAIQDENKSYNRLVHLETVRFLTKCIEEAQKLEIKYDMKEFLKILNMKKVDFIRNGERAEALMNVQQIKMLKLDLEKKDLEYLRLEMKVTKIEQMYKDLEELHSSLITELYEVKKSEIKCEDTLLEKLSVQN